MLIDVSYSGPNRLIWSAKDLVFVQSKAAICAHFGSLFQQKLSKLMQGTRLVGGLLHTVFLAVPFSANEIDGPLRKVETMAH